MPSINSSGKKNWSVSVGFSLQFIILCGVIYGFILIEN